MKKYIDLREFRELGYLQEVNRQFLHPLGLALEIKVADDGVETLSGIWDYRDDPEGIRYKEFSDAKKTYVETQWHLKELSRLVSLGYMVQGEPL